jgi:uncharacterized protein (TIGR00299 family) protein
MHIHIDPLGGLSGDMFLAAILDAWPASFSGLDAALRATGLPETITLRRVDHADHALSGSRLLVEGSADRPTGSYRDIKALLNDAALPDGVRARALDTFALLAEAEGHVHNVPPEDVTFHELADWDSIVDIVGAAFLVDGLGQVSWSVASLPVGRGRVTTSHGPLPVPAPAAARLLEGFELIDDGIEGERVTPTGAVILRHLGASAAMPRQPLRLMRTGTGFGTRTLPGLSNAARLLVYELPPSDGITDDLVGVIEFEIDDQSAEELAVGLDALREVEGVVDLLQVPAFGKKGRMVASIRLLCRPDCIDTVIGACFTETATIGLRWQLTHRRTLPRTSSRAAGGDIAVKLVRRPGGERTAKADVEDVRQERGAWPRKQRRQAAEDQVLEGDLDE